MKIEFLNENKTQALLTRGFWLWKKQAKVIAKGEGYFLLTEWYFAEDPSIRLENKWEQKLCHKMSRDEYLAKMKLRKKTARQMWHAPESESPVDYCKSIYG
jgi:hypothetical protein